jgi:hypothetical protein
MPGREDLEPVAVRILNKVNPHGRIFKADAPHFLMQGMRGLKIVRTECQMEFFLSEVIFLRMILQPGQLQFKVALRIAYVNNNKRSVRCRFAPCLPQSQCFFIKRQGSVQVAHIVIFMDHSEFHGAFFLSLRPAFFCTPAAFLLCSGGDPAIRECSGKYSLIPP